MEQAEPETTELAATDPEMRQLLGMFDVPAFARRGQDLEFALDRLHLRIMREREEMLAMVLVRVRQWCGAATSPGDGFEFLGFSIEDVLAAIGGERPAWAAYPAPRRRRIVAARDLTASVERFNRRWARFLDELPLDAINDRIDGYNRYYLLEKECAFGASRVAARHFRPRPQITPDHLREVHPLIPIASAASTPTNSPG